MATKAAFYTFAELTLGEAMPKFDTDPYGTKRGTSMRGFDDSRNAFHLR